MSESAAVPGEQSIDWREFLTDQPPGSRMRIDRAAAKDTHINNGVIVSHPELRLYCYKCQDVMHCKTGVGSTGRLFGDAKKERFPPTPVGANDMPYDALLRCRCEACGWVVKSYSIRFWEIAQSPDEFSLADVQKLAEWPPFAPRTPAKVTSLIGADRDLFMKGRRAEIEGMGIGAFSYYRRIIETQKNRLLDAIIRVARHVGATPGTIELLEEAKEETQFSRAVDDVRDAIPPRPVHQRLQPAHAAARRPEQGFAQ